MYKAIIEIGGYNVGDTVPEDKAKVWLSMYDVPHVKIVKGKDEDVSKPEKEITEKVEDTPVDAQENMLDDYLARNKNVVVSAIDKDNFDGVLLTKLLRMEKEGKNRSKVITAIENSMKREVE